MITIKVQPLKMPQRLGCRALFLASLLVLSLLAVRPGQAQTYSVLHKFTGGEDGGSPSGGLIRDAAGNLYGTTQQGGAFDFGTVFKLNPNRKLTVLHAFVGSDGIAPQAGLVRDKSGNFYGTTWNGGRAEGGHCRHGCGTVFKLDKKNKETVLYAFSGDADGGNPTAPVALDSAGTFYGTTLQGGDKSQYHPQGLGVVFKLDQTGKETVLYTFTGGADGGNPYAGVILDESGNLYGTAEIGGASNAGVVFELDQAGERVLYSFTGGADGALPMGELIRDDAGNLYGTTVEGGDTSCGYQRLGCGVVFKLDSAGRETVLYTFTSGPTGFPYSGLVRDSYGNFYGTGEGAGFGSVFKLHKPGGVKWVHKFNNAPDGADPSSGVILDKAGNIYGNTTSGGENGCGYGCGVLFKLTP